MSVKVAVKRRPLPSDSFTSGLDEVEEVEVLPDGSIKGKDSEDKVLNEEPSFLRDVVAVLRERNQGLERALFLIGRGRKKKS
jgi:hypothetical protein